jgi:hypothetical protein
MIVYFDIIISVGDYKVINWIIKSMWINLHLDKFFNMHVKKKKHWNSSPKKKWLWYENLQIRSKFFNILLLKLTNQIWQIDHFIAC